MNPTSPGSGSSSACNQQLNVKKEVDADLMELAIKVEGKWEEVPVKCEDNEKPIVYDCDECSSGCCKRMAMCTRTMAGCSGQMIKKEEWEGEDELQLVKAESEADWAEEKIKCEDIEAKTCGELVKAEVKGEEEGETSMANQRCGSASVDSVIIKFEDDEGSCQCEDCGMVKAEVEETYEMGPSYRVEEKVAVENGRSSDDETVIEDGSENDEDWLPSTESNLESSSEEEEETDDGPTELVQKPIETGPSDASLDVRAVAGANTERTDPSTNCSQFNRRRHSSQSGHASHRSRSRRIDDTDEESDDATEDESTSPLSKEARSAKGYKLYKCSHCQKMVANMVQHLRTHTEERPHICDQCGQTFNQKHNLIRHLKIHSGEKAFSCPQCGKCFIQKYHLNVHLKRHRGEKTHKCDQCSRAFVTKDILTHHRNKMHTVKRRNDRAFDKQFVRKAHLRYHNGEKTLQCDQCDKAFFNKSELTAHRRQKHERPYRCTYSGCNFAAAAKNALNYHLNSNKHRQ